MVFQPLMELIGRYYALSVNNLKNDNRYSGVDVKSGNTAMTNFQKYLTVIYTSYYPTLKSHPIIYSIIVYYTVLAYIFIVFYCIIVSYYYNIILHRNTITYLLLLATFVKKKKNTKKLNGKGTVPLDRETIS